MNGLATIVPAQTPGGRHPGWSGRIDALGAQAVVGLAFATPVSTALANVFLALVFACWLAGGRYREKLRCFVDSPIAFAALLLRSGTSRRHFGATR